MNNQPLLLALAPNGAYKQKQDHPAIPLSCAEIVATAEAAAAAGATMLHLHIRQSDGKHTLDPEQYKRTIAAIKRAVGDELIIQITSEAAGVYQAHEQIAAIKVVRPEAVSVALKEIVDLSPTIATPIGTPIDMDASQRNRDAVKFYAWAQQEQIAVQHILYSVDDIQRFCQLREANVLPGTHQSALWVVGKRANQGHSLSGREMLQQYHAAWQLDEPWMICAFGEDEHDTLMAAVELGGHLRVGFENAHCAANGEKVTDNLAILQQTKRGIAERQRVLASVSQAHVILHGGS